MSSSKTNIGGALTALGTTLLGIGIVPQLSGAPSALLTGTAIGGFFIAAVGGALTGFFARDNDKTSVDVGLQGTTTNSKGEKIVKTHK